MSNPTVILNPDCSRTIIQNKGVPGNRGPIGPAGSLTGPVSSTDSAIALFDGTGGNTLKDSGILLSALATVAALTSGLALKQNTVAGKGLSQEDFTTALLNKLTALATATFRGAYADLLTLQAALPTANPGDYAHVEATGDELLVYKWDATNTTWTLQAPGSSVLDGADIASLLFALANTNNFTDAYKTLVDNAVQQSTFDTVVTEVATALDVQENNVIVEATTARTLALTDVRRYIRLTNAGGCTITLPTDVAASWEANHEIEFVIAQATLPTFLLGVGVTLNNGGAVAGLAQWDGFFIKRVAPDTWDLQVRKA
jgi:hypothetical protein